MAEFRELDLKRTYTTLDTDIMAEVVDEILKTTVSYEREVGFFSSSWLKEVAEGLAYFIIKGGKARILTSVCLSTEDWNAIKASKDENNEIENIINHRVLSTVEDLKNALEEKTLATLSFLIKENYLEFKFAIPCENLQGGIFHSKVSIFTNRDGDVIVLAGSQNDSHQATLNEETVNVFTSWGVGKPYADDHIEQHQNKWREKYRNLKIFTLPETAKRNIIETGERYEKQLSKIRQTAKEKLKKEKKKSLRPYQEEAIKNWFNSGCRGFFEMATGTGKTFTSISAINKLYKKNGRICFVVLVPYKHLAHQWMEELEENGYTPIPCFENKNLWVNDLNRAINRFKSRQTDKLCVVSLYATASGAEFQSIIQSQFNRMKWLLVADEAHNAGASCYKKTLFDSSSYRIGLSATPIRWYDEEGTSLIETFFGNTVITYSLAQAIESNMLTPYMYYPIPVELSDEELEEYERLSESILHLSQKNPKSKEDEDRLQALMLQRADKVSKADSKIPRLIELVKRHRQEAISQGKEYKYNLFYAPAGKYKDVAEALAGIGLKVAVFIGKVQTSDRPAILESFANGKIDGIVAIRCLDEGVDVPATQRAYIMSSTSNPKEFIQRRGRILRKCQNKIWAYVYDFIVGPWTIERYSNKKIAVSLLRRELPRFAEFNDCSANRSEARQRISLVCDHFGISDELVIKPYEMYNRNKELLSESKIERPVGEEE